MQAMIGMKKRPIYKSCKKTDDGAQHRASSQRFRYKITQNYVIAWIGYLIYAGAGFGGKVAYSELIYQEAPYGVSIPILRNSTVRHAFEFMRFYKHFSDNLRRSVPGFPLDKKSISCLDV